MAIAAMSMSGAMSVIQSAAKAMPSADTLHTLQLLLLIFLAAALARKMMKWIPEVMGVFGDDPQDEENKQLAGNALGMKQPIHHPLSP